VASIIYLIIATMALISVACLKQNDAAPSFSDMKASFAVKHHQQIEELAEVAVVAKSANAFASNLGCAPQSVEDVAVKPTNERLKVLGCVKSSDAWRQYLSPQFSNKLHSTNQLKIAFVKRWDGLYVIQWDSVVEERTRQALFLETDNLTGTFL